MKPLDYARILGGAARVEWRRRRGRPAVPYKLEFIVTFSCGSRCRTCNIWQRYIDDPSKRKEELSVDELVRTAASARDYVRWISLTGGEVTDRDDFPDIAKGMLDAVGDRLALFQITTNGIDAERVEAILPQVVRASRGIPTYITMSLDGLDDTYQRVRGVPNGYARVKKSMAVLEALEREEKHLTTGWQVTLSDLNVDQADALFEEASRGKERPILTLATDSLQLTRGKLSVDTRRSPRVQEAARRLWKKYPLAQLNDLPPTLHLGLTQRFFRTGEAPLDCTAGFATLTFDPYGGVLQCDVRDRPLARLQDHDFDIVKMVGSQAWADALAPVSRCRECWTPCQAYPTIMHQPEKAMALYADELRRRGRG